MSAHRPSRREFLGTAAALAAWPALPGVTRTAPAAAREPGLKVGLASYSLRKFPLDKVLETCKGAGIRYITLKDVHLPRTDPPAVVKATADRIRGAGLEIMGGGTIYWKRDEAQIRSDFEYAKAAGFPVIVCAPDPDALDLVEQAVRAYDIRIAIHNHGPEDKFYPGPKEAYALIRNRDRRMGLCVDIGHTARTGADIVQTVSELRDRVYDLHLKDLARADDRDSQVEVGKGVFDIPGLFRVLKSFNFNGHAALEYEINPDDPVMGIRESMAYMRGVLDGLETT